MELLLAFRFLGCVCTYRIGETVLVEGVGVRSPEFLMFCLHGTGIILYGSEMVAFRGTDPVACDPVLLSLVLYTVRCHGGETERVQCMLQQYAAHHSSQ